MIRVMTQLVVIAVVANSLLAEQIVLTSGEILKAKVLEKTDKTITVEHSILGTLSIPAEQVSNILADDAVVDSAKGEPIKTIVKVNEPAGAAEPVIKPDETGFFAGWKSSADVGFSGSSGNTKEFNLYSALNSAKENERHRWAFDASYYYSKKDGENTDNKFTTGLLKDWLIPESKWFYFLGGRYDYDQFKSWDQRVSVAAGLGYHLIKKDDFFMDIRVGGGFAKEWGSDDEDLRPEALAGTDIGWDIAKDMKLSASSYIFPDLDDTGEYRMKNKVDWTWKLSDKKDISFKLGMFHEYESSVDAGDSKNDLKYYGALSFGF